MKKLAPYFATLMLLLAGQAFAGDCELEISGNDQLQFDKKELTISSKCEEVTLTLHHTGQLNVQAMGHNVVVAATSEWQALAQAGLTAGLENDYLPPGDERVLVATDMIGGGESTTITFDPSLFEKGGDYTFFCSFPGHWSVMKGAFIVE